MPYPRLLLLIVLWLSACAPAQPTATPSANIPPDAPFLMVVWVEQGNLYTWREGGEMVTLASGDVIRPYLAPDGESMAFTRGSGGESDSLWVVNRHGQEAREIVANARLNAPVAEHWLIGDVDWLDENVLYFNTVHQADLGLERHDDLWRADIRHNQAVRLLAPGEGGAFTFSPDRTRIALVTPGVYDAADGRIRIIDLLGEAQIETRSFASVSTASHYGFYPPVFWEADSRALRVAVPDKDAIYGESAPVELWRVTVDGTRETMGAVPASFFGLPLWSDDGSTLAYLQPEGDVAANRFTLILADGDGANPIHYDSGEAGSLQLAGWLPGEGRLLYAGGQPGTYRLAEAGAAPAQFMSVDRPVYSPQPVGDGVIVFASAPGGAFELYYAKSNQPDAVRIAAVRHLIPVFDARLIR